MNETSESDGDWFAELPRHLIAAACLVRDAEGRILIVKPSYRDCWLYPGGHVEHRESPQAAAEREVLEETGLTVTAGRVLAAAWGPHSYRPTVPILVLLVDGGTVAAGTKVTVQDGEITGHRWVTPQEALPLLGPLERAVLELALTADGGSGGGIDIAVKPLPDR